MEPRKAETRLKTEVERGPFFTSEWSIRCLISHKPEGPHHDLAAAVHYSIMPAYHHEGFPRLQNNLQKTSQFGLSSLAFAAQHQWSGGLGGSEPLPFGLSHRPEQESLLGLGGRCPIFLIFAGIFRAFSIFLIFGGIFSVFRVFGIFLFFGGVFGVFRVFGIFLFFGGVFLIFVSKGPSLTQEIFWLLAWKGPVWGSFTFGLPHLLEYI
ncbi:hypothetical protein Taro_015325 [Colocasia esculenta]|uniref:Uncharacterized protein n=1 Tax=Colocasia esculenta TaxID=4460 RepID=A0A843UB85_COLES|nr:hypothetical protein [Colocasia esculenta]